MSLGVVDNLMTKMGEAVMQDSTFIVFRTSPGYSDGRRAT
jgi:hypothetical protein